MIIKIKDDNKYLYRGFSIQYQSGVIKVYRNNNYVSKFDTEQDAEEYIDDLLEREEAKQEAELVKIVEEPNYIIYKPQIYTYHNGRQNLYRFRNGKYRFCYERDADKYTLVEADEIIAKYPNLRKVKVR